MEFAAASAANLQSHQAEADRTTSESILIAVLGTSPTPLRLTMLRIYQGGNLRRNAEHFREQSCIEIKETTAAHA